MSNRLTSVTPAGPTARSFTYDASGDIVTDTRTGALGMMFQYDVEGRFSKAYQTNAPTQGGTYAYDAMDRLASRTVNGVTTLYIHDSNDHIIAGDGHVGRHPSSIPGSKPPRWGGVGEVLRLLLFQKAV